MKSLRATILLPQKAIYNRSTNIITSTMFNIVECPNCGSKDLAFHMKAVDWHYGNKGTFNLDTCKACHLVFLNPMFNDEELAKFYPQEDYYAFRINHADVQAQSNQKRTFFQSLFFVGAAKEELISETSGRILDIGCGTGWLLYQYKQKGWQVAGVEPSPKAAEIGNKQGLNIFNGTLLDTSYQNNEFDYIHSNHSFEHIYNPNEVLKEVHRILKPNGKILIGIPNIGGINAKIARKYWYYLGAPVHTFNYSPKNITQLLEKHNLTVLEVKHVSRTHGILGSIQMYLNRRTNKKAHEGFFTNTSLLNFVATYIARLENFLRIGDCIEVIATKK
jgi:SAM-dependent methyltransferase